MAPTREKAKRDGAGGGLTPNNIPDMGTPEYAALLSQTIADRNRTSDYHTLHGKVREIMGDDTRFGAWAGAETLKGEVIAETPYSFAMKVGQDHAVALNKLEFKQLPSVGQTVTVGASEPGKGRSIELVDRAREGRRDFRQEATDLIVDMLEKGTAPWQRPWDNGQASRASGLPYNGATGRPYSGGNAMYLMAKGISQGYNDPRWMTYDQANAKGWQVRKGEKATHVEFWQFDKTEKERGEDGKVHEKRVKLERPIQRLYAVFNAAQIDGIPPLSPERPREAWEANAAAERALKNSGAEIVHGGAQAFYQPGYDRITMPEKHAFKDDAGYYGTALHELAHWTGHESRLNRDGITKGYAFGSEGYAREELRAEMASVFLQAELGVEHDLENHAGYVKSWIKVLKEDKNELFRAAKDAGQAADYVIELSKHRELDKNVEQELLAEAQGNVQARYGALDTVIVGTGQGERLLGAALHRELERVAEANLANPADIDRLMSNSPYGGQAQGTEAAQELDTALHELDYITNLPLHVANAVNDAKDRRVVDLRDLDAVAYVDRQSGDLTIAAKSPEALHELLERARPPDSVVLNNSVPAGNRWAFSNDAGYGAELATGALQRLGVPEAKIQQVVALTEPEKPELRREQLSESFKEITAKAKEQLGEKAKTFPAQLSEGIYSGAVIAETDGHLLQQVSAHSTVAHMKSAFQGNAPEVDPDKPIRIAYDEGRANTRPLAQRTKSREQEKALSR